jgi:phosphatidylinositol-4-phosphate 3-kinase
VKASKESLRLKVLMRDLEQLHHSLEEAPTCLPLSPSLEVQGVQVRTCSYFPSNTLPLKINFLSTETGIIPAIFKVCIHTTLHYTTLHYIILYRMGWYNSKNLIYSCDQEMLNKLKLIICRNSFP